MASKPTNQTVPNDDGWEDVPEESQVVFDTEGDEFIGRFEGWSETPGKQIPQAHFTNDQGQFFVNCGWSLKQQLRDVKKGTLCRVRLTGYRDTGQDSPMAVFKVQTKSA